MHTTTNYLLMNLAIADFLTLLFCPGFYDFALHKFQVSGTLGDIFCKFIAGNAIVCVSFDASVLTLCAIAMERYLGIVKPFNKRWALTKKNVNFIILAIWVREKNISFLLDEWKETQRKRNESKVESKTISLTVSIT